MSVRVSQFTTPNTLLPLFPRFLTQRRRGFGGLAALLARTGLSRPAFFLLRRVAEEPAAGSTAADLRPGAPYATRDPHLPWLAEAVDQGYLSRDEARRYRLTPRGHAAVTCLERETTAYLATLAPAPPDELACLAERLATLAAGLDDAAAGPQGHLLRSRRIAALAPEAGNAPLARLERAIFDLWMARDDAHIGAWRAAWFTGPVIDVLTRLWRGDAETLPALHACLAATQAPADVDAAVAELVEQGYVEWRGATVQPTRAGYQIRETIEAETDRRYFHQWPPLPPAEIAWLHATLTRVIAGL